MTEPVILAVDGGATESRGELFTRSGVSLARVKGQAANAWWGIPKTIAAVDGMWRDVASATGRNPENRRGVRLCAALAGAEHPETKAEILTGLRGFDSPEIVSDGYAALVGASGGSPAALVIVGTGTVAHRLHADGFSSVRGGWGAVAGDQGGGAWIGLLALREWLQWRDGILPEFGKSSLAERIEGALGRTRAEVYLWLAKARPENYASLAPLVWTAAEEGDSRARYFTMEAAAAIYRLIRVIAGDPPECPVYTAGGLAGSLRPLLAHDHGIAVLEPKSDANHGAYLIASGKAPAERMCEAPAGGD